MILHGNYPTHRNICYMETDASADHDLKIACGGVYLWLPDREVKKSFQLKYNQDIAILEANALIEGIDICYNIEISYLVCEIDSSDLYQAFRKSHIGSKELRQRINVISNTLAPGFELLDLQYTSRWQTDEAHKICNSKLQELRGV